MPNIRAKSTTNRATLLIISARMQRQSPQLWCVPKMPALSLRRVNGVSQNRSQPSFDTLVHFRFGCRSSRPDKQDFVPNPINGPGGRSHFNAIGQGSIPEFLHQSPERDCSLLIHLFQGRTRVYEILASISCGATRSRRRRSSIGMMTSRSFPRRRQSFALSHARPGRSIQFEKLFPMLWRRSSVRQ